MDNKQTKGQTMNGKDKKKMMKVTVGDNGHRYWLKKTILIERRKYEGLENGAVVLVRFKDDIESSEYQAYRVKGWRYKDEFDKAVDRRTIELERVAGRMSDR